MSVFANSMIGIRIWSFEMKIDEIDSRFKPVAVGDKAVVFLNALKRPFQLEGFPWRESEDSPLFRLPASAAKDEINEGALCLGKQTSGGAIRFRTDSPFIAIKSLLANSSDMNHMPRAGSAGFDLYRGIAGTRRHVGTAQPNRDEIDFQWNKNCKIIPMQRMLFERDADDAGMDEWTVNLPLHGGLDTLEIGIAPDSAIEPPLPHSNAPVLFYGSSITQGGCASRPGNNYASMLCRAVDAEQINLGFSGSARGEIAIGKIIGGLEKLGAFVCDYDHNAPSVEHLQTTHEALFKAVRGQKPKLPVIFISRCDFWRDRGYDAGCERRAVIRATYEHAVAAGDKRVYFIDGETLFGGEGRCECTVDGCHPNDLGFYRMYENILPTLRKSLANAD